MEREGREGREVIMVGVRDVVSEKLARIGHSIFILVGFGECESTQIVRQHNAAHNHIKPLGSFAQNKPTRLPEQYDPK